MIVTAGIINTTGFIGSRQDIELTCGLCAASPQCLTIVLDNALSHPLFEKLLPSLKYSLHDNSEKVRTAFLDMLIKVKAVRAAKVLSLFTLYIVANDNINGLVLLLILSCLICGFEMCYSSFFLNCRTNKIKHYFGLLTGNSVESN